MEDEDGAAAAAPPALPPPIPQAQTTDEQRMAACIARAPALAAFHLGTRHTPQRLLAAVNDFYKESGEPRFRGCLRCKRKTQYLNPLLCAPECPPCCGKHSCYTETCVRDVFGFEASTLTSLPSFKAYDSCDFGSMMNPHTVYMADMVHELVAQKTGGPYENAIAEHMHAQLRSSASLKRRRDRTSNALDMATSPTNMLVDMRNPQASRNFALLAVNAPDTQRGSKPLFVHRTIPNPNDETRPMMYTMVVGGSRGQRVYARKRLRDSQASDDSPVRIAFHGRRLLCTKCKEELPLKRFSSSQKTKTSGHVCRDCVALARVPCGGCGAAVRKGRRIAPQQEGEQLFCTACRKSHESLVCSRCAKQKTKSAFSASMWTHRASRARAGKPITCSACARGEGDENAPPS